MLSFGAYNYVVCECFTCLSVLQAMDEVLGRNRPDAISDWAVAFAFLGLANLLVRIKMHIALDSAHEC